jgi:tetraacyldisaccharide 4'-kinase
MKIGVVSRGYRGSARGSLLVSDGRRILAEAEAAGDEPVMMAQALTGAIVLVDRNRVRGAQTVAVEHRADLVILDDGFQHRRLKRDLDIVLLNAEDPSGSGMAALAGFLREPMDSLKRADIVVLSKAGGSDEELAGRARKLGDMIGKAVAATRLKPTYWRRVGKGELYSADQIAGKKVAAFAGIASPKSFFRTVESLGADLAAKMPLPDHCRYSKPCLDLVARNFVRSKAEWLVTTAKDAVKLPPILRFLPVYYLDTEVEVAVGGQMLDQAVRKLLESGEKGPDQSRESQ